jgi:hypothetical protein
VRERLAFSASASMTASVLSVAVLVNAASVEQLQPHPYWLELPGVHQLMKYTAEEKLVRRARRHQSFLLLIQNYY